MSEKREDVVKRDAERITLVTFKVDGSGEREPVGRPFASMGEKVVGLHRAGGDIRAFKVVCAAYDLVVRRADVVHAEVRVDERWWQHRSTSTSTESWGAQLVPSVALM